MADHKRWCFIFHRKQILHSEKINCNMLRSIGRNETPLVNSFCDEKLFTFYFFNFNFNILLFQSKYNLQLRTNGLLLCISTSFCVLHTPESWLKPFFQPFFNRFCSFPSFFSDFTPEINKKRLTERPNKTILTLVYTFIELVVHD